MARIPNTCRRRAHENVDFKLRFGSLCAAQQQQWPPAGPQQAPNGPQQAPNGPQLAPNGPQQAPTGPQLAANVPQWLRIVYHFQENVPGQVCEIPLAKILGSLNAQFRGLMTTMRENLIFKTILLKFYSGSWIKAFKNSPKNTIFMQITCGATKFG